MQNEKTKKTKSAPRLLGLAILMIVTFIVIFVIRSQSYGLNVGEVRINDVVIKVDLAISSQEKTLGLCCRDSLAADHGMLFVYGQPGNHGFWMKDTRIALDMYWLDSDRTILHIEHDVRPESYPKSFGSEVLSQYVLETNAGFAKKHGIKVGDKAQFELPDQVSE